MPPIVDSTAFALAIADALGIPRPVLSSMGDIKLEIPPGGVPMITIKFYVRQDAADSLAWTELLKGVNLNILPVEFITLSAPDAQLTESEAKHGNTR